MKRRLPIVVPHDVDHVNIGRNPNEKCFSSLLQPQKKLLVSQEKIAVSVV